MKLESIKSVTLTFLISVSLLLTFGLWSYQPNEEVLRDQNAPSSIDVGGAGNLKEADLIRPSTIMFHIDNEHFGFADPMKQMELYKDMNTWGLSDIQLQQDNKQIKANRQVEMKFPTAIPMTLLPSLFDIEEAGALPESNWSFDRILITFIEKGSELEFHFFSENGRVQLTARVNNSSNYERLWNTITLKNELAQLIRFDKGAEPIYITKSAVTLERTQHTLDRIDVNDQLVRILFPKTSLVENTGNYYNDSARDLQISSNNLSMEFINSTLADSENTRIPVEELLDYSRQNINDYKGWTDSYKLVEINPLRNMLRYRMFYEGIPTFSQTNLSVIEQEFREEGELYQYVRPLISLKSVLPEPEEVTLRSGTEVISYLEREFDLNELETIENIKIGYEYTYNADFTSAQLNPAWYMKVKNSNSWQIINFEQKKGGAVDAMESN